jgi:glucose uptake protein
MFVVLTAAVTVLAWGTWIGLAESVRSITVATRTFHVTIGNAVLAAGVAIGLSLTGHTQLRWGDLALPFAGGLVWAAGNYCAFRSTKDLGIARAAGIWTSVNILAALAWGAFAFGEFDDIPAAVAIRLALALAAVLAGLLLIVSHTGSDPDAGRVGADSAARPGKDARGAGRTGVAIAAGLGAGVLWGSYFIPVQVAGVAPQVANLPLSAGMVTGAAILAALADRRIARPATRREHALVLGAGALWGIGNLGMLVLVDRIGAGRGFTIAQLGLIVNAFIGIVAFKNPRPGSRAAVYTLFGVVLAAAGGVLVGQSR